MLVSHLIIDDFLENAEQFRKQALALDYPEPEAKTYFPGRNSAQPIDIAQIDQSVQQVVGARLRPARGTAHGKCRLTSASDKGLGNVHIDNAHWSGILYLNPPEQCSGGTDFFRHIATDSERAPVFPEDLKKFGYSHGSEMWDDFLLRDSNDVSKWERVFNVPMRFNRLTLFRPWLWHNAGKAFGNCRDDSRLVLLLFYEEQ